MVKAIKKFWKAQDTLERKMFWSILVVVTIVATFSAIFTVFEGFNIAASLASLGCAALCFVIAFIAVKSALYNQCYLVMCCMLSCFLLPLLFLFCGGITSGMPLYCITSMALIALAARGKAKIAAFIISMVIQMVVVYLSWVNPDMVFTTLDRDASYLDFIVTIFLTGITLFAVGSLSLMAYADEREKNARLIAKLDYLSTHDPLTGLYNRRYLLQYLENFVWKRRNDYYLAMLDLDNFKQVNCSCGNDFGDHIICTVGKALQRYEDQATGECVARFGCEKYMYVINAGSEVEAYAKVESFRKAVRQMHFEKSIAVNVTVSGGLIPCNSKAITDVKQLLFKVDELVASAKKQGKNQIRNMVEN